MIGKGIYHATTPCTTFTPSRRFFLLFHKSHPEKKASHTIMPPARGASKIKSVSFLQMIFVLSSKISYLPTAFITVHDFKFSNDIFLFVAMILLWYFCFISSNMNVLYGNRTPSHSFPVNFLISYLPKAFYAQSFILSVVLHISHWGSFCSVRKIKQNHIQSAKSAKTRSSGQGSTYWKKSSVVSKLDSMGKVLSKTWGNHHNKEHNKDN